MKAASRARRLRLAVALALWLIAGLSPVAAQGVRRHVVDYRDTLERLAARYGVPLAQLLAINGLESDAVLHVGDEILLPARLSGAEHVVAPGETLAAIAARYGVPMALLAQHNGLWDQSRLVAGQTLLIPAPLDASPPPSRRTLYVAAPRAGEMVGPGVTVRGVGASPDNLLSIRVRDARGILIGEAWAPVRAEIGQQGAFATELALSNLDASESLTLTVQSHHLHDGSVREEAVVPLRWIQR